MSSLLADDLAKLASDSRRHIPDLDAEIDRVTSEPAAPAPRWYVPGARVWRHRVARIAAGVVAAAYATALVVVTHLLDRPLWPSNSARFGAAHGLEISRSWVAAGFIDAMLATYVVAARLAGARDAHRRAIALERWSVVLPVLGATAFAAVFGILALGTGDVSPNPWLQIRNATFALPCIAALAVALALAWARLQRIAATLLMTVGVAIGLGTITVWRVAIYVADGDSCSIVGARTAEPAWNAPTACTLDGLRDVMTATGTISLFLAFTGLALALLQREQRTGPQRPA